MLRLECARERLVSYCSEVAGNAGSKASAGTTELEDTSVFGTTSRGEVELIFSEANNTSFD